MWGTDIRGLTRGLATLPQGGSKGWSETGMEDPKLTASVCTGSYPVGRSPSLIRDILLLHCMLNLVAQCIVIGPVCGFVFVGFVCLWVCYYDNLKLHASIFKLGL